MKSMLIKNFAKSVTTSGSPEALSATPIWVSDFKFHPRTTNGGANMYVGDSALAKATALPYPKGGIYSDSLGQGRPYKDELINLQDVYIDGDANGDTMVISYKTLGEVS